MAVSYESFPDGWLDPEHIERHLEDVFSNDILPYHPEYTQSPAELVKEELSVTLAGLMGVIDALSPRDAQTGQHRRPKEDEIDVATRRALIAYHTLYTRMPDVDKALKHYENGMLRDPLTGLYAKAYFQELEHMIGALGRRNMEVTESEKVGFALVVFDIDDFKAINDKYGHPAGDIVLKTIGQRIQEHRRANDIEIRYGGDEFVLYLDGISYGAEEILGLSGFINNLKHRLQEPVTIDKQTFETDLRQSSLTPELIDISITMGIGLFKPQFAVADSEKLKQYEAFSDGLLLHAKQLKKGQILSRKYSGEIKLVDIS